MQTVLSICCSGEKGQKCCSRQQWGPARGGGSCAWTCLKSSLWWWVRGCYSAVHQAVCLDPVLFMWLQQPLCEGFSHSFCMRVWSNSEGFVNTHRPSARANLPCTCGTTLLFNCIEVVEVFPTQDQEEKVFCDFRCKTQAKTSKYPGQYLLKYFFFGGEMLHRICNLK